MLHLIWRKQQVYRKLNNEEPHNMYSSPGIPSVIKPRKMRFVGHVACMGRGEIRNSEGRRIFGIPTCRC
jgi:hypothetical protein